MIWSEDHISPPPYGNDIPPPPTPRLQRFLFCSQFYYFSLPLFHVLSHKWHRIIYQNI